MFGFGRRRKKGTAPTFVEATGGGWSDVPLAVPADGGDDRDYVHAMLQEAQLYAVEHGVPVGGSFTFMLTDIPVGIVSPHEIVFGLMMQAGAYGLMCEYVADETASFVRMS